MPQISTSSKLAKALLQVPRDGQFYAVLECAMSSAEQIARQHNHPGAPWEYWYYLVTDPSTDEITSVLAVRSV
jgi:hypothetical protein